MVKIFAQQSYSGTTDKGTKKSVVFNMQKVKGDYIKAEVEWKIGNVGNKTDRMFGQVGKGKDIFGDADKWVSDICTQMGFKKLGWKRGA